MQPQQDVVEYGEPATMPDDPSMGGADDGVEAIQFADHPFSANSGDDTLSEFAPLL
jgi:hypothetical protein